MMKRIEIDGLHTKMLGGRIFYFDTVPSTNDYLKGNASSLFDGDIAVTECQSSGKGRMGHTWEVPPGESVALSILLKNIDNNSSMQLMPHCAGLAVLRALKEYTKRPVFLKWPNDVILEDKKVCGILCESVIGARTDVVIGIGINILQDEKFFRDSDIPNGGSLKMFDIEIPDTMQLVGGVLTHLEKILTSLFVTGDFSAALPAYRNVCINIGRPVNVIKDGESRSGVAIDVDKDGNLIVDFGNGGISPVFSGEASIRGTDGYF